MITESIKHLSIDGALLSLDIMHKRAATPVTKAIKSALANAVNNAKLDKNNLQIESINVTAGQSFKRYRPSTRGRIHPYKRRSSNIRVVLSEKRKGGSA